jgi:hypothetical protein
MRMRVLSLVLFAAAMASGAGCDGSSSGRCDAFYSRLEQMPEFKQAGYSRYGNQLRTAFNERCGKLQEADLKCLEEAKAAGDLEKCSGGRDAFEGALGSIGGEK